ncbi:hypothetical protein ACLKA6_006136 [Drosophila palustris]
MQAMRSTSDFNKTLPLPLESKLMQAMRSTSDLQQNNPSRSLECFQYYSDVFDQLLKQYQMDYANCQNTSKLQTADIDDKYKQVLSSLNDTTVSSCQQLIDCNNQADSLQGLSCYSDVAAGNVRSMYNISSMASDYYGSLQQDIQLIQFRENQCINSSQRSYELNTDQAYINLQNCLMGLEPVPTTSPSTTSTSIASTATTLATSAGSTQRPTESFTETTTTGAPTTSVSTRRTRRPRTSTPSSLVTTNSAVSGSQNSLSNELKKWLNSLRL